MYLTIFFNDHVGFEFVIVSTSRALSFDIQIQGVVKRCGGGHLGPVVIKNSSEHTRLIYLLKKKKQN